MSVRQQRLGFLIPPGNPTTEPEIIRMTPPGVTVHFTRMVAHGVTGSLDGQEERNRTQIAHLPENIALLAMVKPAVIVLAHTASSYTLGKAGEQELIARIEAAQIDAGIRFITAFGSVIAACKHLGVQRIAVGTPYSAASTQQCQANLEANGLTVVNIGRLEGVSNIYDETPERAYQLGRQVETPDSQAVFLSGVGMPTVAIIARLEQDLGKPVISSAAAMMWNALRFAGVQTPVAGFGSLLAQPNR